MHKESLFKPLTRCWPTSLAARVEPRIHLGRRIWHHVKELIAWFSSRSKSLDDGGVCHETV